jgi:hypothetical protein
LVELLFGKGGTQAADLPLNFLQRSPDVVAVLSRFKAAARSLLLVSDLNRTRLHVAAATLWCYALTRSRVVRHDGPASVRA